MKIAFATAQRQAGSTNVGRILPLAVELQKKGNEVHILALTTPTPSPAAKAPPLIHSVGTEPFKRTSEGKERMSGIRLILNMLVTAIRTAWTLRRLHPDVIVISKPLPSNVAGVWLYIRIIRVLFGSFGSRIILDTDDFELTANQLSSIYQRAVVHWSERTAARLAKSIVAASPFLSDYFKQLTQNSKPIEIIPTGIFIPENIPGVSPVTPQGCNLAYLGSVSISSGHRVDLLPEILSKVVAQNPEVTLALAGDGDDTKTLKEEFANRRLDTHVKWHGRFEARNGADLVSATSIILDPVDDSISNRAKGSFRVMLAGILGVPVVTSNIGIRPELIPTILHERFFADPGKADSYSTKINELIKHPLSPEERHVFQTHSNQFTWEKLSERYYDVITTL